MDGQSDEGGSGQLPPETSSSSSSSPSRLKRRRAVAQLSDCCRTCRLRKVKCTGNPGDGPCSNCARLELQCIFISTDHFSLSNDKIVRSAPSQNLTEAGTLRKRAQRACRQCHAHKTKCSGDLPRCKRCEASALECEYAPAKRKFTGLTALPESPPDMGNEDDTTASGSGRSTHPQSGKSAGWLDGQFLMARQKTDFTTEMLLARKNLLTEHLEAYNVHLYSMPSLGFLHPKTTYDQIQDGSFHPAKAAALCAAVSFWTNPGRVGAEFRKSCSEQVEGFITENIFEFSEVNLVVFALDMVYSFLEGSLVKAWLCFGVPVRLMLALQANWDVPPRGRSFVELESLRRAAWQVWNMDRLMAEGYDEYVTCPPGHMKVRLPCNEEAFLQNRPVTSERLSDKPGRSRGGIGLHGFQLRLVDVRHRISSMIHGLLPKPRMSRSHLEPSKIMEDIASFQQEVNNIHGSYPESIRLSDQSIARYIASPTERVGYYFLHGQLAVSHIELYRFALPGMQDQTHPSVLPKLPAEFVIRCQKQAVGHAMCLARFYVYCRQETKKMYPQTQPPLTGDCSAPSMTTHLVRILLIALQHELYHGLQELSTAPNWRFEQPDEEYILQLIRDLILLTEEWVPILGVAKFARDCNKAMLASYEKTRKFTDQKGSYGWSGPKPRGGDLKLPGPHFLLESINADAVVDDIPSPHTPLAETANTTWTAASAEAADHGIQNDINSSSHSNLDPNFDMEEFAPPGMPTMLQRAHAMDAVAVNHTNFVVNDQHGNGDHDLGSSSQHITVPQPNWVPSNDIQSDEARMMSFDTTNMPASYQMVMTPMMADHRMQSFATVAAAAQYTGQQQHQHHMVIQQQQQQHEQQQDQPQQEQHTQDLDGGQRSVYFGGFPAHQLSTNSQQQSNNATKFMHQFSEQ